MAQDLASIDQEPVLLVFLDLLKAYNTLESARTIQTLEGYGAGPKMQGLLVEFWENQEVVTRKNVYHGTNFRENHGTTHGGLALPTLFNVAVESVLLHWLSLMVEDKAFI